MDRCPSCKVELPNEDLETCPNCGQKLHPASTKRIELAVRENHGKVVGINAKKITGDVFASGDLYQVQVYVLSQVGRRDAFRALEYNRPPYKFLVPYGPRDLHLFFGREQDTEEVLRRISTGRLVILYGAAGVGKTSLLTAGVIPNLISHGALVVLVQDYTQPLGVTYRKALSAETGKLKLALPEGDELPRLVRAVRDQVGGTQVLVLDQVERIFGSGLTAQERLGLLSEVVQSLQAVEDQYLRLVLAVREDAFVRLVADLQSELAREVRIFKELRPLSREQAEIAVLEPVRLVQRQIVYEPGLVKDLLIPELDRLSPGEGEGIHPPHLQIVCSRLYDWVVDGDRFISKQKYVKELRGAEGVLASYLDDILGRDLVDQRPLAESILVALATAGAFAWRAAEEIGSPADPEEVASVLRRLAERGLVERGLRGEKTVYALTSKAVEEKIFAIAGEEIERGVLLKRDMRRYWEGWKQNDDLVGAKQLRRFAAASPPLQLEPLESLLLLRSASRYRFPPGEFIGGLRNQKGFALIDRFESFSTGSGEGPVAEQPGWAFDEMELEEARRLLGLAEVPAPPGAGQTAREPYGPLARHAVQSRQQVDSQTAALALLGALGASASDRLRRALHRELSGIERWRRTARLRGALAEADPQVAGDTSDLGLFERLGVWGWRVRQRAAFEGLRLLVLVTGAAVGSGLALGAFRFLTALILGKTPGLFGLLNFVYGWLLAAGLVSGHLISGHLLLRPVDQQAGGNPAIFPSTPLPGHSPEPASDRRQRWFAVLTGAAFCFLAYLVIAFSTGSLALGGKGLVLGAGAVACLALSLGLSLALKPWPVQGLRAEGRGRAIWLSAAALTLIQAFFVFSGNILQSLVFLFPAADYRSASGRFSGSAMPAALEWYHLPALLDAALTGLLLMGGLLAGFRLAWKSMENHVN